MKKPRIPKMGTIVESLYSEMLQVVCCHYSVGTLVNGELLVTDSVYEDERNKGKPTGKTYTVDNWRYPGETEWRK